MDGSERIAHQYLLSLGIGDPVYEPDGNRPPDFAIDNRTAIEVRRLNQHRELPEGDTEPLAKATMPLIKHIERLLPDFGPGRAGESWFVHVFFSRPVGPWKELRPRLEIALQTFIERPEEHGEVVPVSATVELRFRRAKKRYPNLFLLGGYLDYDSGGSTLAETVRALEVCIPEKERKIAPYRSKYPDWWLVLINHIGYRLEAEDQVRLRQSLSISHSFNKIVLVNPLAPSDGLEL